MVFVYIHGAKATSESFTYIRSHLDGQEILIDYNSENGFVRNLNTMAANLVGVKDIFFIAHSLGGVYALHLANMFSENVLGGVTLATPYGGSREADYIKFFLPFSQLMRDISPRSFAMSAVKNLNIPKNWTNVVTTQGSNPWRFESNDGVVSHSSMRYRTDMELVDLPLNHYEIVISNKTVEVIKDRVDRANAYKKSAPVKRRSLRIISS